MVSDAVAEKLEKAGLWRRAAARWLEVMKCCHTDAEREWISQKRRACYARIEVAEPERLNVSAVSQAASLAQDKMGIRQLKGAAFRTRPPKNKGK